MKEKTIVSLNMAKLAHNTILVHKNAQKGPKPWFFALIMVHFAFVPTFVHNQCGHSAKELSKTQKSYFITAAKQGAGQETGTAKG